MEDLVIEKTGILSNESQEDVAEIDVESEMLNDVFLRQILVINHEKDSGESLEVTISAQREMICSIERAPRPVIKVSQKDHSRKEDPIAIRRGQNRPWYIWTTG